jgi:hypothetical protein
LGVVTGGYFDFSLLPGEADAVALIARMPMLA